MKKIISPELIDENAKVQFENCFVDESVIGVLTADAHKGYRHPIGGVVGYLDKVSLSGVGYDIGCGNNAVKLPIKYADINSDWIMDMAKHIRATISFGIGRKSSKFSQHEVVNKIASHPIGYIKSLLSLAEVQLGTVGAGNHYIDFMYDQNGDVWLTNHFGSRGFGHKLTTGFISLFNTGKWSDHASEGDMDLPPLLFDINSDLGREYYEAVKIGGEYAQAGRDLVVDNIVDYLGVEPIEYIRNHHNFCWEEDVNDSKYYVVRKGATPVREGVDIYIGGSMATSSYVVTGGVNCDEYLYSAPHGAGRQIGRSQAKGKIKNGVVVREPLVNEAEQRKMLADSHVRLFGGDLDEMPACYKDIEKVIGSQDCYSIKYELKPFMVFMADNRDIDPYKD